jgi:hypothetical protein
MVEVSTLSSLTDRHTIIVSPAMSYKMSLNATAVMKIAEFVKSLGDSNHK